MSGLYDTDFVENLRRGAAELVTGWGLSAETRVTLLTLSENATFRADDPGRDRPVILRVQRPGYHSTDEILSELDWISALRASDTVRTAAVLPRLNGDRIATFSDQGMDRHVVAFDFMPGSEPDPESDLTAGFRTLGEISAQLHQHARSWTPPAGFRRKTWNHRTAFGPEPLWGDWRAAIDLDAEGHALLQRLSDGLERRLAEYGESPDRFGLVHADLRLANLLAEGDRLSVIDFDDCGFSWFAYDFAAAISFIELSPQVPALMEAWVQGYRDIAPFAQEHVDILPAMVLFRRLLLTAWIASHPETETARWAGLGAYTKGTLELAEAWLSGRGIDTGQRV